MSTDWTDPSLKYSLPAQLTATIHRKVPDELQPETDQQQEAARGKIVVITGGGSGIGAVSTKQGCIWECVLNKDQAIARVWVRAGAEGVIIAGRRQNALEETLLSLKKLNTGCTQTSAFSADVTQEDDAVKLFEHVQRTFGRSADVVFANAGLMLESKPLAEENINPGGAHRGGHKQVKQVSHSILACLPSIRSHEYLLAKNKQVLVFT
jgi:NADP-dependent 3-hydroxy acid dehydrogenase YdfG